MWLQQLQYMCIAVFREQWIILINPTSIVEKEILSVFNSVSLEANDIKMAEHLGIKTKIPYT